MRIYFASSDEKNPAKVCLIIFTVAAQFPVRTGFQHRLVKYSYCSISACTLDIVILMTFLTLFIAGENS